MISTEKRFVFDCALAGRKFYLPRDGKMKLQFFHVQDLCRLMDAVLNSRPARHIFNAGNKDTISVRDWAELCYKIAGKQAEFVEVFEETDQRNYFCFDNYEYCMDVSEQDKLLADTKRMDEGLRNLLSGIKRMRARWRKCRTWILSTGVFENNEAAIKCYEACGFKRVQLETVESYRCMGEVWNCIEMELVK